MSGLGDDCNVLGDVDGLSELVEQLPPADGIAADCELHGPERCPGCGHEPHPSGRCIADVGTQYEGQWCPCGVAEPEEPR